MANPNVAFGLWPRRQTTSGLWTGGYNMYFVPSTDANNIFLGDPMIPTGAADANGVPVVTLATAGSSNYLLGPMMGIVNGGEPIIPVTRDLPIYRQASVATYIYVADDPNLFFEIQENGNMGTTAAWSNANLVSGTGSTVTGQSGWQLNSSTSNTTNTLQLRVITPIRDVSNTVGTNCKWMVRINLHALSNQTGI